MAYEEHISKLIKGLGDRGGNGNVLEILAYTPEQFEDGFQLANHIQNLDLVKLLYSNFNQHKIIVEFTLLGKARYELLQ